MVFFIFTVTVALIAVNSAKNPTDTTERAFEVSANSGIEAIASNLQSQGLVADKTLFILYAKFGPSRGNLQPGIYLLSPSMPISRITGLIGSGQVATRRVTFREGLTIAEVAQKWAKTGLGDAQGFINASQLPHTYQHDFLKHRAKQDSLEGYLFPATYDILITTTPQQQINTMLDTFKIQVLPKLPPGVANSSKLHEIITLASIVEKEARTSEDRKLVAGVFYNRLALGMKLESDVTINYVTGKTRTEASDLKIDNLYNSYLYKGLPPTPICSPGLDAILATASPTTNDYLFFIADNTGKLHFAKTYTEHEQNIHKYLK